MRCVEDHAVDRERASSPHICVFISLIFPYDRSRATFTVHTVSYAPFIPGPTVTVLPPVSCILSILSVGQVLS